MDFYENILIVEFNYFHVTPMLLPMDYRNDKQPNHTQWTRGIRTYLEVPRDWCT